MKDKEYVNWEISKSVYLKFGSLIETDAYYDREHRFNKEGLKLINKDNIRLKNNIPCPTYEEVSRLYNTYLNQQIFYY